MSCFIEFSPVFMIVHHIQHVGIQITEKIYLVNWDLVKISFVVDNKNR